MSQSHCIGLGQTHVSVSGIKYRWCGPGKRSAVLEGLPLLNRSLGIIGLLDAEMGIDDRKWERRCTWKECVVKQKCGKGRRV